MSLPVIARTLISNLDSVAKALGEFAGKVGTDIVKSIHATNEIQIASQTLGMSAQKFSEFQFAANSVNVDGKESAAMLTNVTAKIFALADGRDKELAAKLGGLNINFKELTKLSPDRQLINLSRAINNLDNQNEQVFVANAFDKLLPRLLPILDDNGEKYAELVNQARDLNVSISDADAAIIAQSARSLKLWEAAKQGYIDKAALESHSFFKGGFEANTARLDLAFETFFPEHETQRLYDNAKDLAGISNEINVSLDKNGKDDYLTVVDSISKTEVIINNLKNKIDNIDHSINYLQAGVVDGKYDEGLVDKNISAYKKASNAYNRDLQYYKNELNDLKITLSEFEKVSKDRAKEVDAHSDSLDKQGKLIDDNSKALSNQIDVVTQSTSGFYKASTFLGDYNYTLDQSIGYISRNTSELNNFHRILGETKSSVGSGINLLSINPGMNDIRAASYEINEVVKHTNIAAQSFDDIGSRLEVVDNRVGGILNSSKTVSLGFQVRQKEHAEVLEHTSDKVNANSEATGLLNERLESATILIEGFKNQSKELPSYLLDSKAGMDELGDSISNNSIKLEEGEEKAISFSQVLDSTLHDASGQLDGILKNSFDQLDGVFENFWDDFKLDFDDLGQSIEGSFEGMLKSIEQSFSDSLKEMAHEAITRPIVLGIQQAILGDNGNSANTSASGSGTGGLNPISLLSSDGGVSGWLSSTSISDGFASVMGPSNSLSGNVAAVKSGGFTHIQGPSNLSMGVSAIGGYAAGELLFDGEGYSSQLGSIGSMAGNYLGTTYLATMTNLGSFAGPIGAIAGALVGAIAGSMFAESKPEFDFRTRDSGSTDKRKFEDEESGVIAQSAFGELGFDAENTNKLKKTFGGFDKATSFLTGLAAMDNTVAALAQSDAELQAMIDIVQQVNIEADNPKGVLDQISDRYLSALSQTTSRLTRGLSAELVTMTRQEYSVIDDAFFDYSFQQWSVSIENALLEEFLKLDLGKAIPAITSIIQMERIGDAIGGAVTDDLYRALNDGVAEGADLSELTAHLSGAMTALPALESLNSSFDITAIGALEAASNIVEYAGGIQNLLSSQQQYYDLYYSEAEKTAAQQELMAAQFEKLGMALPESKDGFRELVDGLDLTTEKGQKTHVALMALAPAFAEFDEQIQKTRQTFQSISDNVSQSLKPVLSSAETLENTLAKINLSDKTLTDALVFIQGLSTDELASEAEKFGLNPEESAELVNSLVEANNRLRESYRSLHQQIGEMLNPKTSAEKADESLMALGFSNQSVQSVLEELYDLSYEEWEKKAAELGIGVEDFQQHVSDLVAVQSELDAEIKAITDTFKELVSSVKSALEPAETLNGALGKLGLSGKTVTEALNEISSMSAEQLQSMTEGLGLDAKKSATLINLLISANERLRDSYRSISEQMKEVLNPLSSMDKANQALSALGFADQSIHSVLSSLSEMDYESWEAQAKSLGIDLEVFQGYVGDLVAVQSELSSTISGILSGVENTLTPAKTLDEALNELSMTGETVTSSLNQINSMSVEELQTTAENLGLDAGETADLINILINANERLRESYKSLHNQIDELLNPQSMAEKAGTSLVALGFEGLSITDALTELHSQNYDVWETSASELGISFDDFIGHVGNLVDDMQAEVERLDQIRSGYSKIGLDFDAVLGTDASGSDRDSAQSHLDFQQGFADSLGISLDDVGSEFSTGFDQYTQAAYSDLELLDVQRGNLAQKLEQFSDLDGFSAGMSISEFRIALKQAEEDAAAGLISATELGQWAAAAVVMGEMDSVVSQIANLDVSALSELYPQIKDLEDYLTSLNEYYADQLKEIEERYSNQIGLLKQQRDIAIDLKKFVDGIRLSEWDPAGPQEKLIFAEKEFNRLLEAAKGTDEDAIKAAGELQSASNTYLQHLDGYYGRSDTYTDKYTDAMDRLNNLGIELETRSTEEKIEALNQQMLAEQKALKIAAEKEVQWAESQSKALTGIDGLLAGWPAKFEDLFDNAATKIGGEVAGALNKPQKPEINLENDSDVDSIMSRAEAIDILYQSLIADVSHNDLLNAKNILGIRNDQELSDFLSRTNGMGYYDAIGVIKESVNGVPTEDFHSAAVVLGISTFTEVAEIVNGSLDHLLNEKKALLTFSEMMSALKAEGQDSLVDLNGQQLSEQRGLVSLGNQQLSEQRWLASLNSQQLSEQRGLLRLEQEELSWSIQQFEQLTGMNSILGNWPAEFGVLLDKHASQISAIVTSAIPDPVVTTRYTGSSSGNSGTTSDSSSGSSVNTADTSGAGSPDMTEGQAIAIVKQAAATEKWGSVPGYLEAVGVLGISSQADINAIVDGSHAKGLGRVPFNGYRAALHKDEMVLPADISDHIRASMRSATDQHNRTDPEMLRELQQLRAEVASLRAEQSQANQTAQRQRDDQHRATESVARTNRKVVEVV
ncbi:hypothetical protein [Oceanospirillum sediminis]|uniref:Uncharacterized protein n=1 Tax=Oceanospirillum sediminis TaxID=2760088 RepID=A0A839ILX2_9GAMM|nr:hypothetical protein [Oceanospirillum sediminis]MBB1485891.1 hypothetical protein [Oceanospirillum sediminis]